MYTPGQIGANLATSPDYFLKPWDDASKELKSLFDDAVSAKDALVNASIAVTDMDVAAQAAKREWELLCTEKARKGEPLADDKSVTYAEFQLKAAREDEHAANMRQLAAELKLGSYLEDEAKREEWIAGMQADLEASKKKLATKAPEVLELADRVRQLHAYSTFLRVWPMYGSPEVPGNASALNTFIEGALSTELHRKPVQEAPLHA